METIPYVNERHREDTDYVVRVAKTLLLPLGIWPRYGDLKFRNKLGVYARICLIFCLMLFLLIPHFIWTWYKADNLRKLMKIIAAQVFSALAVFKFCMIIKNASKLCYCLELMENDYGQIESEEDRRIMVKNAKIGRLFTIAYLGLLYGGALPYHVVMPLLQPRLLRSSDNTTFLPLPYPSEYVFFVVENPPFYEIVFFIQMFISFLILSVNAGVYSLITSIVMHSCGLFEVTNKKIIWLMGNEKFSKSLIEPRFSKQLARIVAFHVRAIWYTEAIENALNIVILAEMVSCTLIICMLEYGALLDMEDGNYFGAIIYGVLITSIFVNVFILSFIGDKIKEQSKLVGFSTYNVAWYDLPNKTVLNDIKFIIARANQPTRLTAGKLFDLSLQGFCDVAKTSLVYFNFLRALEIT